MTFLQNRSPYLMPADYLGKAVFGRTGAEEFFHKRREETPEKDWIVYHNAHWAIISKEFWETWHQRMKAKRKINVQGKFQVFADW